MTSAVNKVIVIVSFAILLIYLGLFVNEKFTEKKPAKHHKKNNLKKTNQNEKTQTSSSSSSLIVSSNSTDGVLPWFSDYQAGSIVQCKRVDPEDTEDDVYRWARITEKMKDDTFNVQWFDKEKDREGHNVLEFKPLILHPELLSEIDSAITGLSSKSCTSLLAKYRDNLKDEAQTAFFYTLVSKGWEKCANRQLYLLKLYFTGSYEFHANAEASELYHDEVWVISTDTSKSLAKRIADDVNHAKEIVPEMPDDKRDIDARNLKLELIVKQDKKTIWEDEEDFETKKISSVFPQVANVGSAVRREEVVVTYDHKVIEKVRGWFWKGFIIYQKYASYWPYWALANRAVGNQDPWFGMWAKLRKRIHGADAEIQGLLGNAGGAPDGITPEMLKSLQNGSVSPNDPAVHSLEQKAETELQEALDHEPDAEALDQEGDHDSDARSNSVGAFVFIVAVVVVVSLLARPRKLPCRARKPARQMAGTAFWPADILRMNEVQLQPLQHETTTQALVSVTV